MNEESTMRTLPEDSPYEKGLISLIVSISHQIPMDKEDQILIAMKLNTVERIMAFNQWVKEHLDGEELKATAPEIVRAAVQISKEL